MKKIIVLTLVLFAVPVFAISDLEKRASGTIQGAAPNASLSQILTIASTTIDVSENLWWGLYAPTACKYRLMPTSAKGSYPQFTAPADIETSRVINRASTKFLNLSGCTLGELSRQ